MVLAIIALIAVPIVLNIIESARKGAAVSSARSYIKAVDTYTVSSMITGDKYRLASNTNYKVAKEDTVGDILINDLVEIKGTKPYGSEDYIILDNNYTVDSGKLTINEYVIEIENGDISTIVKGNKIAVKDMVLNYSKQTMERGSSFQLIAGMVPNDATDTRVAYKSKDESIASVDEKGNVIANKVGKTKIEVTSIENTSIKKECEIEVIVSASGIELNETNVEIKQGQTYQLIGTLTPSDTTTNALEWSSSNNQVAYVDSNGLVTGVSEGEAKITAKTVNGKSAVATIKVKGSNGSLTITLNEIRVGTQYPESLAYIKEKIASALDKLIEAGKDDIDTSELTELRNGTYTWDVENKTIASVDSTNVNGIKVGKTTLIARVASGKEIHIPISVSEQFELSEIANVGDYVDYDAGEWTSSASLPTSHGQFGGYTAGNNKANSVSVCRSDSTGGSTNLKGWRVLSIDKGTKTVTIVHAGHPECYYHKSYESASNSITSLNNRATSQYLNNDYASSAHNINKTEAEAILESNDLRAIGSYYYLANPYITANLYFVYEHGVIHGTFASCGVRPVVVLKSNIKTGGKTTDTVGNTNAWSLVKPN